MKEYQDRRQSLTGDGIPYHLVYHLLEGSPRPIRSSPAQNKRFYDANLLWREVSKDLEIQEINSLEMKIGQVTPFILDLRTMVDFCCIWRYDYPDNFLSICRVIGEMKAYPARCHYQIGIERGRELNAYASALLNWIKGEQSFTTEQEREITAEVFKILGIRNQLKEKLVERTYLGLINRHIDCSFFGYDSTKTKVTISPFSSQRLTYDWQSRIHELEREIMREMGSEGYNFLGEPGGVEPPCHFKYIRRLLILIGSIGVLKWRGYVPPIDPKMKGRRELTHSYLTTLESFFKRKGISHEKLDKQEEDLREKILKSLGESDTIKKWLAFSLWKNLKNQTLYQAYTMKRWIEFGRIKDSYIRNLLA